MKSEIVLIEIKDSIDIVDIVADSIDIKSRKGVWFFNIDGRHKHIQASNVNNVYIGNDNLMFNKVLRFGDVSGEKDFWDKIVIDTSQEYSYCEIGISMISKLQDRMMTWPVQEVESNG